MEISNFAQEILEKLWTEEKGESKKGYKRGARYIDDKEYENAVKELISLKLVEKKDGDLFLTPDGLKEAEITIRRHRLAERVMSDIIGSSEPVREDAACRLEHILIEGLDEAICTLLGHPKICPHGKPIPAGNCCKKEKKVVEQAIFSLANMKDGESGKIVYLYSPEKEEIKKLMAIGVLPGKEIKLIRRFPSYFFEIGYNQFAVDEEIASSIFVRRVFTSLW